MSKLNVLTALAALTLSAGAARAASLTFEILPPSIANDVSADGTVIVGNMPDNYETFRWTAADGVVRLGRSTLDAIGVAAGTPGVSADGTRICATILSDDGLRATQGVWTLGAGWKELSLPPDGGVVDFTDGSAWAISKDGSTCVGLYWRPGSTDGLAHASTWNESTGMHDLGSIGRSSRANGTNGDGSVTVGWVESATGSWMPAAWRNGALTVLNGTEAGLCMAQAVTPDGSLAVGLSADPTTFARGAAAWRWTGTAWTETLLGVLPGTVLGNGFAQANDVRPDGKVIVGYNSTKSFGGSETGFIWTHRTGMIDVEKLLARFGYAVSDSFNIRALTGISDDGRTLVGYGSDKQFPFNTRTFVVRLSSVEEALADFAATASKTDARIQTTAGDAGALVDVAIFDCRGLRVDTIPHVRRTDTGYAMTWSGLTQRGTRVARGVYYARPAPGHAGPVQRIVIAR